MIKYLRDGRYLTVEEIKAWNDKIKKKLKDKVKKTSKVEDEEETKE